MGMVRDERGRTWVHLTGVVIVALLTIEVALSVWRPQTFPRLRVLPAPADRPWDDGCNEGGVYWETRGPVWVQEAAGTLAYCPDVYGPLPRP